MTVAKRTKRPNPRVVANGANPLMLLASCIRQALLVLALIFCGAAGAAELTLTGLWRTTDDATGKAKALVSIIDTAGIVSGQIVHLFDPDPKWDGRCERCRDHRKDQPVLRMVILTDVRKDGDEYKGGEILDPENGNVYRCRLRLTEDGNKLEVRGFIGIALFGRTQIWLREK